MKCRVCDKEHDNCSHSMTGELYCLVCAFRINKANPEWPDLIDIPLKSAMPVTIQVTYRKRKIMAAVILLAYPAILYNLKVPGALESGETMVGSIADHTLQQAMNVLKYAMTMELAELWLAIEPTKINIE